MNTIVTFVGGPANLQQHAVPPQNLYQGAMYRVAKAPSALVNTARPDDVDRIRIDIAEYLLRKLPGPRGTWVWVGVYWGDV